MGLGLVIFVVIVNDYNGYMIVMDNFDGGIVFIVFFFIGIDE